MAVQRLFLGRMNGSRNLANVVTFVIKSRIPAIPNFAVLIKYWRRIRLSNTLPGAWRVAALTTRVLRLAPFWPIFRLEFVHGTRKVGEIFSDVERILIAQGAALPERHVVFDERGSGKRAGHTGAVVERIDSGHRRKQVATGRVFHACAVGAMAAGALRRVHLFPVRLIGCQFLVERTESASLDAGSGRDARRQPLHVSENIVHLRRIVSERFAVHRPLEAIVYPLRQGNDLSASRTIFRKYTPDSHPGGSAGGGSPCQVAAGAIQAIADVPR